MDKLREDLKDVSDEKKRLELIFQEANRQIKEIKGKTNVPLKFSTSNKLNTVAIMFPKGQALITPGKKEVRVQLDGEGVFDIIKPIIDTLNLIYEIDGLDILERYKTHRELSLSLDAMSDLIQKQFPGPSLYVFLAQKYGYCVPYILDLEFSYNSDKKGSFCELTKEKLSELRIEGRRPVCQIQSSNKYNDCVESDKDLIVLITHVKDSFGQMIDHHISILLIDNKAKEIEYYDPLGSDQLPFTCYDCIKRWTNDIYPDFQFNFEASRGLQCLVSEGSCFLVNLFYFYLKMVNKRSMDVIIDKIKDRDLPSLVSRFADYLDHIASGEIGDLINLFQKYEAQMSALSVDTQEDEKDKEMYKRELEESRKLYNKLDKKGFNDLLSKSVYSERSKPLNETDVGSIIEGYLGDFDIDSSDTRRIIRRAQLILGTKEPINISDARRILEYKELPSFEKAVEDNILSLVKKTVKEEKPSNERIRSQVMKYYTKGKYQKVIEYLLDLSTSFSDILLIKETFLKFLQDSIPERNQWYIEDRYSEIGVLYIILYEIYQNQKDPEYFDRLDQKRYSIPSRYIQKEFKRAILELIKDQRVIVNFAKGDLTEQKQREERERINNYYYKLIDSIELNEKFSPTEEEKEIKLFNPWSFVKDDFLTLIKINTVKAEFEDPDIKEMVVDKINLIRRQQRNERLSKGK